MLGRTFDGIEYRGYAQPIVQTLADYAGVPVWNGLTTEFHPTQMLADVLTMREEFGNDLSGRKLTFMGDAGNNVGNSLMVVCAKLGIDFCACGPEKQMPAPELVEQCRAIAAENGSTIDPHRGRGRGRAQRLRHLHGHLGLDGRARQPLGRAHQAPEALPGHR